MGKYDISNKDKIFLDSIGQKATIHREQLNSDKAAVPNRKLCDIGLELNPKPNTDLKYLGSAAVHIYAHEMLGQLFVLSQTDGLQLYRCPEKLADKAFVDLQNAMKEMYGRKRGKLRSGY